MMPTVLLLVVSIRKLEMELELKLNGYVQIKHQTNVPGRKRSERVMESLKRSDGTVADNLISNKYKWNWSEWNTSKHSYILYVRSCVFDLCACCNFNAFHCLAPLKFLSHTVYKVAVYLLY